MAFVTSITETEIFTTVRTYIMKLVDCEVIRAQKNRAAMPVGAFVSMSAGALRPLETNRHTIRTETVDDVDTEYIDTDTPSQMTIPVDCYGAGSGESAQAISAMFRDDYACQVFRAVGHDIQPLFATDPQQMPLVNGEDQYEERWTFNLELQVNHKITISTDTTWMETAGMLAIGTPPTGQAIGTVFVNGDGIIQAD